MGWCPFRDGDTGRGTGLSVKLSAVGMKGKMASGEVNPLAVKVSQVNAEEGDAKTELQWIHF